jgi:hypothetical protein
MVKTDKDIVADTEYKLALCYLHGKGVAKNLDRGKALLASAVENGSATAKRYVEIIKNRSLLGIDYPDKSITIFLIDYAPFKNHDAFKSHLGKFELSIKFSMLCYAMPAIYDGFITVNSNSGITTVIDPKCPYKVQLKNFSVANDKFDFVITK